MGIKSGSSPIFRWHKTCLDEWVTGEKEYNYVWLVTSLTKKKKKWKKKRMKWKWELSLNLIDLWLRKEFILISRFSIRAFNLKMKNQSPYVLATHTQTQTHTLTRLHTHKYKSTLVVRTHFNPKYIPVAS